MSRLTNFYLSAALFLIGLMLIATAGEVVMRTAPPFAFRVKGERIALPINIERHAYVDDPRWSRHDVVNKRNSLGFRGAEPPADLASRLTVLTIGGSTTECFYLTEGATWPDRLQQALAPQFGDLWLNNAGLDGHSTFGHIVLVEDVVAPLHPKVAVYLLGANDIGSAAPRPSDRRDVADGLDFSSLRAFADSVANASEIAGLAANVYRVWRARGTLAGHDIRPLEPSQRDDVVVADAAQDAELARHGREFIPAYRDRLRALVGASRAAGIDPVFVTQPSLYGPARDDVSGLNLGGIGLAPGNGLLFWRVLELYNDATRDIARSENVRLIDLAHALPKSSRLFYDSMHFTEAGAAAAAVVIARELCPYLEARYPDHARAACAA